MIITETLRTTTLTYPHHQQQRGDYFITTGAGIAIKRIRTPHPNDVLSGRGGGINSHPGNCTFREWVKERKNEYNLSNKADKARVAREVIDRVKQAGGRFLMRDPTGGVGSWWIELDDIKTMAKTSQALREGAPSIRAQHKDEIETNRLRAKRAKAKAAAAIKANKVVEQGDGLLGLVESKKRPAPETEPKLVVQPLLSNAQFHGRPTKIIKLDETPPITPSASPNSDTPTLLPVGPVKAPSVLDLTKEEEYVIPHPSAIEMSFSELSGKEDVLSQDFVNPFENEEEKFRNLQRTPGFNSRVNVRNISSRALIDLDPIGSYENWDDSEFAVDTKSDASTLGLDLDDGSSVRTDTSSMNPLRWNPPPLQAI